MMRPVNETAQVIPFVHAANMHPVAHTKRNTLGKIDIVGNQQGSAGADIQYESLMPRTVIIIG